MKLNIRLKPRPKRFLFRTETCLNCGHALDISDRFCSYCGQKNSSKALNLKELIMELLSSLISYDSRLRKTIAAFACRPGKISREYIQGKRVKYVNPFRFFISTAIVFFLTISWINREDLKEFKSTTAEEKTETDDYFDYEFDFDDNTPAAKIAEYLKANPNSTYPKSIENIEIEDTFLNRLKFDFLTGYDRLKDNPKGFLNFLLPKLPFFLFFFVPIFSIFSSLLYIRRKVPYTHHLIFNYNQQTVFLIFLLMASLLDFISFWIWLMVYLFYLYKSIRKFYSQRRIKTLIKLFLMIQIYWITALVVFTGLAILSIAFF